jgi:hypothetical protein
MATPDRSLVWNTKVAPRSLAPEALMSTQRYVRGETRSWCGGGDSADV